MAINQSHVDFFSLDVQGVEREFLSNFPFDEISVDVWAIEGISSFTEPKVSLDSLRDKNDWTLRTNDLRLNGGDFTEDVEFIEFMEKKGYYLFEMHCSLLTDYIFIRLKSELFKKMKVPNNKFKRRRLCDDRKIIIGALAHDISIDDLRSKVHWPDLLYKSI